MPFSSNQISAILKRFSVEPGSAEAWEMKKTIEECEAPAMEKEEKYCATSLEATLDYSKSKQGTNVQVLATEEVGKEESPKQGFTISPGVTEVAAGDKRAVVCHAQNYPNAVFHCHFSQTTKAFLVPMVGALTGPESRPSGLSHGYIQMESQTLGFSGAQG